MVAKFYHFLVQTPDIAEVMPSTVSTMTSGKPLQMVKATMRLMGVLGKNIVSYFRPSGVMEWGIITMVVSGALIALLHQ
jgi:hypothetical protein